MEGGYALKVAAKPAKVVALLRRVARDAGLGIEEGLATDAIRGHGAQPIVPLGIGPGPDGCTLVVVGDIEPSLPDDGQALRGLGAALASHVPLTLVLDMDEGAEVIERWGDGSADATTGWCRWDDPGFVRISLRAPPYADLSSARGARELSKIGGALFASVVEAGVRAVALAALAKGAPEGLFPPYRLTLEVPRKKPVSLFLVHLGSEYVTNEVARAVSTLLTKKVPASSAMVAAVGQCIPQLTLDGLSRRGFDYVTWYVTGAVDGKAVRFEVSAEGVKEEPSKGLIRAFEEGMEDVRRRRRAKTSATREGALYRHLARGDLSAAAKAYRALHADYYAGLSDGEALASSLAKVRDLARLSRAP
jgi:hypothetical protein